jgi:hypothetical protein
VLVTGRPSSIARATAVLGLVVLAIGTFLPWLKSGHASRNSYQAGGAIRRLIKPPGALDMLFSVWPLLAAAAAAAIALFVIDFARVATAVSVVTAVLAGAAAFWAVESTANAYASVLIGGPSTTLVGAAIVIVAAPFSVRPERPAQASTTLRSDT